MKQFVLFAAILIAVALGGLIVAGSVVEAQTPPNRAPVISGPSTIAMDENSTTTIAAFDISDPDGDELETKVDGVTAYITDDGVLKFYSLPDYERHRRLYFQYKGAGRRA